MAKEQGAAIGQLGPLGEVQAKSPDGTRAMGSPPGKPRVLMPVEDPAAPDTGANSSTKPPSEPLILPAANETNRPAGASNFPADLFAEPLRASRLALDELLAKTHDIHEQIWRAVESLLADLHSKLSRECEARLAEFDKELGERGRYQTGILLDQIDLEAESRLAARMDRALDKAHEAERRGSQVLDEKIETSRAAIAEIAGAATRELQSLKASSLEDLQANAKQRLADLKSEYESNLKAAAQKAADALDERQTKQSDTRFQSFQERLKRLADESTGLAESRLKVVTDGAIARAAADIQATITRETSTYLIDALHKRLDQLARSLKE
jgi:hypothetical protein